MIASVSGGKDSTALCLHLQELAIPYEPVFMDTGWETPETYRYLREELPRHVGAIRWLRSEVPLSGELEALAQTYEARLGHYSAMVRWILKKGMFPSGVRRFCTQELKVRPMGRYLESLDVEAVNAVGVRAEESAARARLPEWETPEGGLIDAETWRPLIRWMVDDVIAIHQRHGVTPNRGYFKGSARVGCWPCIRSNKEELRVLGNTDPERVQLIADLERDVATMARARMERRGTTLEAEGYSDPTWFQSRFPDESGRFPCWPIERVIQWSRTTRGGKQLELFAARPHEMGCVRWGMCDTGQD
ncbi:MAG: putative 37 [Chloroflexota bacterium]